VRREKKLRRACCDAKEASIERVLEKLFHQPSSEWEEAAA